MIKIAVDTTCTRPPLQYGGISEYTFQILRAFGEMAEREDIEVMEFRWPGVSSRFAGLPATPRYQPLHSPWMRWPRLWRLAGAHLQARRGGADVLFCPNPEVLLHGSMPAVCMIHDLAYRKVKHFSRFQNLQGFLVMRQVARRSRFVLTNSECSKRDVVKELRVSPSRVVVSYLAYDRCLYNPDPVGGEDWSRIACRHNLGRPFILHVGTLQPRKNLERLIAAYRLMLERHPSLKFDLVLAGALGWQYEPILRSASSGGLPGRVIITGKVEAPDLPALVKNASLSVVPSLYEGFCIPMLESMACGVPTVVANNSCFPEVSGGVLRYFDAESVEGIAETMYDVLQSPKEQNRLRQAGLKRAAEFSWERCAREALRVLRDAASGN